jgi:asparagine synthase (glutamine-hydrolysing)
MVARETGCQLRRLDLWREPIADDIETYLVQTEGLGPLGNYWSWALYRMIKRDGVSVTLDGQGADELLCGYPHTIANSLLHPRAEISLPRVCRALRVLHGMGGATLRRDFAAPRVFWLWLLALVPFTRLIPKLRRALECYDNKQAAPDLDNPDERKAFELFSPIRRAVYQSVCYGELQPVLRLFDKISMSHGVEARMPFLDWRLISYVLSLPDDSYLGKGYTKRILRDAMRNRVPELILARREKVGFSRPISDLLRGPLRAWALHQLNRPSFLRSPEWDGESLRRWFLSDILVHDVRIWRAIQRHWILEDWGAKTRRFIAEQAPGDRILNTLPPRHAVSNE